MSLNAYLNKNEEIKIKMQIGINEQFVGKGAPKKGIGELALTSKRVIRYTKVKNDIEYRDIPIDKISYIEHKWRARKLSYIIAGAIFMVIGIIFLIMTAFSSQSFFMMIMMPIFIIIGLILCFSGLLLLIKGFR